MSDSSNHNLLLGFLSGALVGGIVALLYAPKPGKELRDDLLKKGGDIADDLEVYIQDAQEKAKIIINEGKEKSTALISDAKKRADTLLQDAEGILTGARQKVTEEGDKLKTAVKAGVDTYRQERDKGSDAPAA
jgi:gas vesicle protein